MKKKLLFTAYDLNVGGIETALINLLNNINYEKYEVTLILEKKEGALLNSLNKNVILKEIKVSENKITILRKIINYTRKLKFSIFYKNKFDFSCCYATYSYSGNKIALIASENNSIYVHSNYNDLYRNNLEEFKNFFDTRNITNFKRILFVSHESCNDFLKHYPNLKEKTRVFNNFIDIKKILKLSEEKIKEQKKPNKTLFVYVGRLDDSSKKLSRAINLIKNIDNTILWLVGDGKDKKMYEDLVEAYNVRDRVLFLGEQKNPYPYMKCADYIILTSDYEGFPVTYLESIVLNKKIITTINVSSDQLNIKDYAKIVSKDSKKMIEEVKEILKSPYKNETISLDKIQKDRIKQLEKIFDNKE